MSSMPNTSTNRAVVIDPSAPGRLSLAAVERPHPTESQALVRVAAISLNRGEVRNAASAPAGFRPGWDLAGTVEQAAADGTGPKAGVRVVGFLANSAWGELAAVPTNALAELPDSVTFAQAATLPVAGLTALYGLDKGGNLLGRRALIIGASGGVGQFGVQLARAAGATVTAQLRSPERRAIAQEAGAHHIAVGEPVGNAADFGPYDVILDGVAGPTLTEAIKLLDKEGTYVLYGATPAPEATIAMRPFFAAGGLTLYGFILFHEILTHPASHGLSRLAGLVESGLLHPPIEVEAPIDQIGTIAVRLMDRGYAGKAVLHF